MGLVVGEDVEYVLNILPVALPKGRMGPVFWVLLLEIALEPPRALYTMMQELLERV